MLKEGTRLPLASEPPVLRLQQRRSGSPRSLRGHLGMEVLYASLLLDWAVELERCHLRGEHLRQAPDIKVIPSVQYHKKTNPVSDI
jgi:hypothetical protein